MLFILLSVILSNSHNKIVLHEFLFMFESEEAMNIGIDRYTLFKDDIIYYSELESNYIKNVSSSLSPISMNFYYVLFNKSEKGYTIIKYDNNSTILGKCNLFLDNTTEKIDNYFFEEKSKTIYIISSLNKVYI